MGYLLCYRCWDRGRQSLLPLFAAKNPRPPPTLRRFWAQPWSEVCLPFSPTKEDAILAVRCYPPWVAQAAERKRRAKRRTSTYRHGLNKTPQAFSLGDRSLVTSSIRHTRPDASAFRPTPPHAAPVPPAQPQLPTNNPPPPALTPPHGRPTATFPMPRGAGTTSRRTW